MAINTTTAECNTVRRHERDIIICGKVPSFTSHVLEGPTTASRTSLRPNSRPARMPLIGRRTRKCLGEAHEREWEGNLAIASRGGSVHEEARSEERRVGKGR